MDTGALITLSIAGMPLCFRIRNARLAAGIKRRYAGWIIRPANPHILFECAFSLTRGTGRSSMPKILRLDLHSGHIVRGDFECHWQGERGSLRLRSSIYSFDAAVRVLFATLLPHRGVLMLHASAIVAPGRRGVVFPGRSGSGKTTMARLLGDRVVLNDELCVVTCRNHGAATVSGTPFWGEMRTGPAHPEPHPLEALCFLSKSTATARLGLGRAEALRRLLQTVCSFSRDAVLVSHLFTVAQRIVERAPAFEFRFRRDAKEVSAALPASRERHALRS